MQVMLCRPSFSLALIYLTLISSTSMSRNSDTSLCDAKLLLNFGSICIYIHIRKTKFPFPMSKD